jgi:hypothetical protein
MLRPATTFEEMGIPVHQDVPESKRGLASAVRRIMKLNTVLKLSTKSAGKKKNKKADSARSGSTKSGPESRFPSANLIAKDGEISPLSLPSPVSPVHSSRKMSC